MFDGSGASAPGILQVVAGRGVPAVVGVAKLPYCGWMFSGENPLPLLPPDDPVRQDKSLELIMPGFPICMTPAPADELGAAAPVDPADDPPATLTCPVDELWTAGAALPALLA